MPSSYKPLLEDKERFSDSSFRASSSTKGHSPSDARISSGSSWCAPVADGKHYLQMDFGRVYYINPSVTYGDSNSPRWVSQYQLNYTIDMLNWRTLTDLVRKKNTAIKSKFISSNQIILFSRSCVFLFQQENKNAYNKAALWYRSINARLLRFIPLTYVGQPCMRFELFGQSKL